jgi:hypothetical protein
MSADGRARGALVRNLREDDAYARTLDGHQEGVLRPRHRQGATDDGKGRWHFVGF